MAWCEDVTDQTRTRPSPPPEITLMRRQRKRRGRQRRRTTQASHRRKRGVRGGIGGAGRTRADKHGNIRCRTAPFSSGESILTVNPSYNCFSRRFKRTSRRVGVSPQRDSTCFIALEEPPGKRTSASNRTAKHIFVRISYNQEGVFPSTRTILNRSGQATLRRHHITDDNPSAFFRTT